MFSFDQSLVTSISMREIIITSILYGFGKKTNFFEGRSCFKFSSLGLEMGLEGMDLKFYASVPKGLKIKVRKT